MIKVIYHRSITRLTVEGHARFAEEGKDLVCASATILAYTLASFVEKMEQEKKCWAAMSHFEKGTCIVSCIANEGYKAEVTNGYDIICRGFDILSEKFPDYVSFEIK